MWRRRCGAGFPVAEAQEEEGAVPAREEEAEEIPVARQVLLKAQAQSKEHLLFHKPYNPYCDGCNAAKMRDVRHFKGAYDRKQTSWGESLTCDHLDSRADVGLTGDKQAVVIKDLFSKLRDIYPARSKDVIGTEWSIADFVGDRTAKRSYHQTMYSDQEEAIKTACRNLKIKSDFSQPGVPRNNSIIERSVGDVVDGTRTLLRTAGMPTMFWP